VSLSDSLSWGDLISHCFLVEGWGGCARIWFTCDLAIASDEVCDAWFLTPDCSAQFLLRPVTDRFTWSTKDACSMIRLSSEDCEDAGGDEGGEGELQDGMSKPGGN
jgi:hypothetical protein